MARRDIEISRAYAQSETGALVRDWGGRIPIALVFPNSYRVGMSSLAIHALYGLLNAQQGLLAERAFAWLDRPPDPDTPVLTIESQRPIAEAAVIAASLSFEMDYFHLVDLLRRAQVPPRAGERDASHPLVLLGGPAVSANPAPLFPLADAIVIGEVEPIVDGLAEALRGLWDAGRQETLVALSRLPGVIVPQLMPRALVQRQQAKDLDAFATQTVIVAPHAEFGDMHLVEISRGCTHGCRFCLAGSLYRPYRERSVQAILAQARAALPRRAKFGLVGAAVSDYTHIDELTGGLRAMGATLSVSSLRVRPLPESLIEALEASGSRSITIAPEAGSERLRGLILKGVTAEDVLEAASRLRGRFASLKLYSMVGLPTETDADLVELVDLAAHVRDLFGRQVVLNVTPFVPKAHTPFQRVAMAPRPVLERRLEWLRSACRAQRLELRSESAAAAQVQAVLARGDARIGAVLLRMARPSANAFMDALGQADIDLDEELGPRSPNMALPWDIVQMGPHATLDWVPEGHAMDGHG